VVRRIPFVAEVVGIRFSPSSPNSDELVAAQVIPRLGVDFQAEAELELAGEAGLGRLLRRICSAMATQGDGYRTDLFFEADMSHATI